MKPFYYNHYSRICQSLRNRLLPVCLCVATAVGSGFPLAASPGTLTAAKKGKQPMKTVTNYLDPEYSQVGDTRLYLRSTYNFDFWGLFGDLFYGSTFGNGGYYTALKVNDNYAETIDTSSATELYDIQVNTLFEPQGEMVRVSYVLKNLGLDDAVISLGTYADVQIGDNDCAPISRRVDANDYTYGLTMKDGGGAELCILFGEGLSGVTPISDFWFGNYGGNSETYNIVGEYYDTGNFMLENGSYDSAMGWCWKDQIIPVNDTAIFSFLIGIGDVTLQPGISYAVTPEDSEGWNNIWEPHRINIEGTYTSPAGADGRVEYALEYPEFWYSLTEFIPSGSSFSETLDAYFDPGMKTHTIYLRIVDTVGNTTMLDPIEYLDISHVEFDPFVDFTYDGTEHFQNVSSPEIDTDKYVVGNYEWNRDAGTASFIIEGIYPETIGRRYCEFQILPAPLEGAIILHQTEFDFGGYDILPEYSLEGPIANLQEGYWFGDYRINYTDNHYAGTALMTIEGVNNYCGELAASFTINKVECPDEWIGFGIPEEDITYDGEQHAAWAYVFDGAGEMILTYVCGDSSSEEAPSEAGDYEVFLEFAEGPGFYAIPRRSIGTFSIYNLNDDDWNKLLALNEELSKENNMADFWELTNDKASAAKLTHYHINIEKGHITQISLPGRGLKGELPLSAFRFNNANYVDLSYNEFTGDIDRLAVLRDENPEAISSLQTLYLGVNKLTGNAGVLSQFPNIKVAHIGFNSISEVIPMLKPDIEFPYDNQTLDLTLNLDLRDFDLDSLVKQIPSIVLYDHYAQSYSPQNLGVYLYDNTGWDISIDRFNGEYLPFSSNDMRYQGQSGDILEANLPNECHAKVQLWFNQGDVNFNASVDLLDLQSIINDILGRRYWNGWGTCSAFNFTAGNLYEDEVINVQDAVCLVNMLLESDPTPAQISRKSPTAREVNAPASVFADGSALFISSEKEVAAFDVIVDTENVSLEKIPGMALTKKSAYGKTRIIGYSLGGNTIEAGTIKIADADANTVSFVMLSDANAMEISTNLNSRPSAIAEVSSEKDVTITPEAIYVALPAGVTASWQILSATGMILAQDTDTAADNGIIIPFNAAADAVYILSVSYDGKHLYKKFNRK